MGLEKKVILVAGVGEGLGTAVVCLLASEGATVVGVARGAKVLEKIVAHARIRNWKFSPRTADMSDPAQVDRTIRSVVDEFGRIDAISINIGRWVPGETLLHKMSDAEWSAGIHDNLDPFFQVARATLPHFIERGVGSVVLVSAAPGVRRVGSAAYCAAKGGLADLVPKLAADYRATGVRINAVLPGSMRHELEGLDPPSSDGPIGLTDQTATSPWEVARAIRYLLSDESRWVTGTLVTVDGGVSSGGPETAPNPP